MEEGGGPELIFLALGSSAAMSRRSNLGLMLPSLILASSYRHQPLRSALGEG
jgi:hypothetical protein